VRLGLLAREHAADQRDVVVVPRVPVGKRRAVSDARDLVAVVPPTRGVVVVFEQIEFSPQFLSVFSINVAVVPRVPVGERRAVGDARDLVAVVPPKREVVCI
jgi:hypothetical protein